MCQTCRFQVTYWCWVNCLYPSPFMLHVSSDLTHTLSYTLFALFVDYDCFIQSQLIVKGLVCWLVGTTVGEPRVVQIRYPIEQISADTCPTFWRRHLSVVPIATDSAVPSPNKWFRAADGAPTVPNESLQFQLWYNESCVLGKLLTQSLNTLQFIHSGIDYGGVNTPHSLCGKIRVLIQRK